MSIRSTYHIKQNIEDKRKLKEQIVTEVREICNKRKLEIRSFTHDDRSKLERFRKDISNINEEINELEKELREKNYNYNNNNTEQQMEKRSFSLLNTIKNVVNNVAHDNITNAVLAEGQKAATRSALNPSGQIQLPLEMRSLTVADEGNDVVAVDMFNLVERLREESTLSKLGVTFMSGLVGNIQFPKMGALAATWENEVSPTADSTVNLESIKVEPFRLSIVLPISKQLLLQSDNIGLENHLRSELVNAISEKIEATYFGKMAKTATSPAGLFAPGATVTACEKFEDLCALEAKLEENHVKNYQYVVSPRAKAAMRAMPKSAKTNELVLQNNEVDGRTAVTSTYLDDKNFVIGQFKDNTKVCFWGPGLDLLVDNVTLSHEGKTRLVANVYVSYVNVRPEALVCGKIGK